MTFRFPASQYDLAIRLLEEVEEKLRSQHKATNKCCLVGGHNPPCTQCSCGAWVSDKDTNHFAAQPDAFEVVIHPLPSLAIGEGDEQPVAADGVADVGDDD